MNRDDGLRPLSQAQHDLAAALVAGDANADVLAGIVPGGTLEAEGAFAVYRNGYLARLAEQLGETYPAVWQALGDEEWFALCEAYTASHPSTSYNLSDYGRDMAAFLERRGGGSAALLAELARFELVFHDLFHAAACPSVEPAELASLGDLTGVRLQLGAAVRLVACERAVYDVFRHRHEAEAPAIDLDRRQFVVLFRRGNEVLGREIDEATFAALGAFARGAAVEDALADALERDPGFGAPGVTKLFELVSRFGLVESISR